MSNIKWSEYTDSWLKVKQSARTTVNREGAGKYPDKLFRKPNR